MLDPVMGKTFEIIGPDLREWIAAQPVFFVATAPLSPDGRINCSPKGGDTFRVVDETSVAYLDLTGSGIETVAHLQENGRIVILFCAFSGPPKIVRLHGHGSVVYPDNPDFEDLLARFSTYPGARAIIRITVSRISDSCGFAVPLMDYREDRRVLDAWATKTGVEGLADYRRTANASSIDGLAGYRQAPSP